MGLLTSATPCGIGAITALFIEGKTEAQSCFFFFPQITQLLRGGTQICILIPNQTMATLGQSPKACSILLEPPMACLLTRGTDR